MIIDTHLHLNLFSEHKSLASTVSAIIPATTAEKWTDIDMLCKQYHRLFPAYGLHPWFSHTSEALQSLEKIAHNGIAVGECGLDFRLSNIDIETQKYQLYKQLDIATQFKLPVIFHCVKAEQQLHEILRSYPNLTGVIHGYSGSYEQAKDFINLGFYIGINHLVDRSISTKLHRLVSQIPITQLLLETDAPNRRFVNASDYLSQRNALFASVATLRDMSLSELVDNCNQNAETLFNLEAFKRN